MNAAVGLMDGLGLDGDRCIRVIPRQILQFQLSFHISVTRASQGNRLLMNSSFEKNMLCKPSCRYFRNCRRTSFLWSGNGNRSVYQNDSTLPKELNTIFMTGRLTGDRGHRRVNFSFVFVLCYEQIGQK